MKTKELVSMSLLMGIGFVLHAMVPGFFFGMKPDIFLVMMFVGILLFPKLQHVVLLGLGAGLLSAFTTTFPSGQIPNIIDKVVTALVFFLLLSMIKKYANRLIPVLVLTFIGTIISGTIFLGSAVLIAGLPASFLALFYTVVVPTALINTIAMFMIYPVVHRIYKQKMVSTDDISLL